MPSTYCTSRIPSAALSFPAGRVTGVGAGRSPGRGSGYAVVVALWKVMLPSVLVNYWWMWPFRQVPDENRFM